MKSFKTMMAAAWRPVAGVLGLAAVVAYSSGGCTEKTQPGVVDARPGRALPEGAETIPVERTPVAARVDVTGTVGSEATITLSAKVPAHVKKVFASAGMPVKVGQELVLLDDRDMNEQLAAAEAQLRMAEAEYKRARGLFESKAATEQQLLAAETGRDAARSMVERAKVMMTYARIVSPIDGVVTDRRVEEGDLASPGQVLLALYDPLRMRLEAPVPMRLVEKLALDQKVTVVLDRPAREFSGSVTEIVSEVDPLSRTRKVKVRIDDDSGSILPGTFGRLWIDEGRREAILLPASAVMRVGQMEMAQVVENGRVLRRLVKTGPGRNGRVEIVSGLDAGEVVLRDARM
jgi:RND family efflux transporter MFP subunit